MAEDFDHLPDADLLRVSDGELDPASIAIAKAHLAACPWCRTRQRRLQDTLARFVHAYGALLDEGTVDAGAARARLRARLGDPGTSRSPFRRARIRKVCALAVKRPAWSASGVVAAAVVALVLSPVLPWNRQSGDLVAFATPDASLTPGATVLASREVVCGARPEPAPPVVSRTVALAIFRTYGITDPRPHAFELDYLIAPELGGSKDVSNLWPQSYSGVWNAHLKDALEEHLHALVCGGAVALTTAQREIAADWIGAYKKYFQTDAPLAVHQQFRKDHPWR